MDVYSPTNRAVLAMQVSKNRLLTGAIKNIDRDRITCSTEHAVVKVSDTEIVNAQVDDWILKPTESQILVLSDAVFKKLFYRTR